MAEQEADDDEEQHRQFELVGDQPPSPRRDSAGSRPGAKSRVPDGAADRKARCRMMAEMEIGQKDQRGLRDGRPEDHGLEHAASADPWIIRAFAR